MESKLEKLKTYFSSINGKNVESKQIVSDVADFDKAQSDKIEAIFRKPNGSADASGGFKTCHFIGESSKIALLKSREIYFQPKNLREDKIIRLNRALLEQGALIPKIYSVFFADRLYCEIQKRAMGNVVAISNIRNFVLHHFNIEYKTDLDLTTRLKIGKKIFEYNVSQQELMKKLPQKCYDDLVKTFILLKYMKVSFKDGHAENLMVSDKGFTVIDIDYDNKELFPCYFKDDTLEKQIFSFFSFAYAFKECLTKQQIKTLQKNNVPILKKLINGLSNNNIVLDVDDNKNLCSLANGMIDINNWHNLIKYKRFVCESQKKLRNGVMLNQQGALKMQIKH